MNEQEQWALFERRVSDFIRLENISLSICPVDTYPFMENDTWSVRDKMTHFRITMDKPDGRSFVFHHHSYTEKELPVWRVFDILLALYNGVNIDSFTENDFIEHFGAGGEKDISLAVQDYLDTGRNLRNFLDNAPFSAFCYLPYMNNPSFEEYYAGRISEGGNREA